MGDDAQAPKLSFLVGGAPKAATTSLIEALRPHPDVFIPERKELSFFDGEAQPPATDLAPYFASAAPHQRLGEGTPWYMSSPTAAERLASLYPHLRVVFVVREPVARARSHYLHRLSRHSEYRSLEEVLDSELEDLVEGRWEHRRSYLIRPGLYASHVELWHGLFSPEQVLVVLFEDLIEDPGGTLRTIQRHIGVPPRDGVLPRENETHQLRGSGVGRTLSRLVLTDTQAKRVVQQLTPQAVRTWTHRTIVRLNRSRARKSDLIIPEAYLARMRRWFDPEVDRLASLLGRDLDAWRHGS